ncbi:MAG: hypothetical protein ABIQ40_09290 [Bacteroidia bacterium]
MKKTLLILSAIALTQFFVACGGSADKKADDSGNETAADGHYTTADFTDLDLTPGGINATMKAPKGATIKKSSDGSICVQAGKYFQMNIKALTGSTAKAFNEMTKELALDKEENPSFAKMAAEETNGFMTEKTDGELSFSWVIANGEGCIYAINGVPYADASEGYTEVPPPADVRVMWEAAKTIKVK